MKNVLRLGLSLLFMFSAFNITSSFAGKPDGVTTVKLSDFNKVAGEYVGKKIRLTGIVDHVCEHDGKKMFLVEENSDARVKIVPDENLAAFKQDLVGETVEVTGIVKEFRLDEDYLMEMEENIKADSKEEPAVHMGEHKGKKEEQSTEDKMKQLENLRKKLKDSGKEYLSYFSVEAVSYKVLK